ncbi:glycosyl hydrolase family 18 protein [Pseudomonas graminis]
MNKLKTGLARSIDDGPDKFGPLTVVYVEASENVPLSNVGRYSLDYGSNDYGSNVFDIAIIFAANINGSAKQPELYINSNVQWTLDNAATQIRPLQAKGIKVLLSIVGNHQEAGISNMPYPESANWFAVEVANLVKQYNLDGVDLDDEYSDYTSTPPNIESIRWLIFYLRLLLPDKIISLYATSSAIDGLRTTTPELGSKLSYAWNPDYGTFQPPEIPGLDKPYLAAASIDLGNRFADIQSLAQKTVEESYGMFMTYNLVNGDHSRLLSEFTRELYEHEAHYT